MSAEDAKPNLAERLGTVRAGPRSDLEISRHMFRGEPSYVVRNPITFQSHHFSVADYQVLIELDGDKALGEIFDRLVESGRIGRNQEEEYYVFVLRLHQLGLLNLPVTDGKSLYARFRKRQSMQRRAKLTGFLFWRVPLLNPDALLDRTIRHARPLFSRLAVVLWAVLMLISAGILWRRWGDFTEPLQSILVMRNLAGMWVLLIALKVVHEFGHAYACKMYGGKVPEMGAYFICFTPCAYVDASAAWGFSSKMQRLIVSLGGMYVESIVAGIAVLIWNATGPSLVNSFAHQTILLAGIVTVAFNMNPLMRYDGYYVFSDLVEIPNLSEQSHAFVKSLGKRWLLGVRGHEPRFAPGIRWLLFVYGVLASAWKVSLVVAICAGIALKVYLLGAALAVVFASMTLWNVIARFVQYLFRSPETAPVRGRAMLVGSLVLVAVPLGIAMIPIRWPIETRGVVHAAQTRPVFARTSGFLRRSDVEPGHHVELGAPLFVLDHPEVEAAARIAEAKLEVWRMRAECDLENDPIATSVARQRADQARRDWQRAWQDVDGLTVRAPWAGQVADWDVAGYRGRFVREGERLATILAGDWTVRALATAQDLADVKPCIGQPVRVRLSSDAGREFQGTVREVAVQGSETIKDASLTQFGGGTIVVAPDTMVAGEPFFEITVALTGAGAESTRHGTTAIVSFPAESRTLGKRLYHAALRFVNKLRTAKL